MSWCSQQRGVFTRPLLDYTFADMKEQFYTRKECATECTVGCVRTASRFDEWRRQPRSAAAGDGELIPAANLTARSRQQDEGTSRRQGQTVETR